MARSEPLIIDRETGEPKNGPFTAHKYEPWKVIIVEEETNVRKSKKFFSYVEAKETAAALQEKYGETHTVGVVSRQIGYGPPYAKVSDRQLLGQNDKGLFWCPYCRKFRAFKYVPVLEQRWCEFCHTRERDFHVRACNPLLWDPVTFKRIFGEVYADSI